MSLHVRPSISHSASPSGHDYGHELTLERINEYGERASCWMYGEMTLEDLRAIAAAISGYLKDAA